MSHAVASEHRIESTPLSRGAGVLLVAVQIAGAGVAGYLLGLPVWVTLAGLAVFYSRGSSLGHGTYNLACAITGLGLGIVSLSAAANFDLNSAWTALPAALLLAAISVQLMQFITGVSNVPNYYIGILIALVANMETSLDTYLTLTAAVSVGVFAATLPALVRRALGIGQVRVSEDVVEVEQ
ncbi:DUF1097 domain-containing protein [Microbulbifer hainanensis]|uniref:DUF1097 domain-containing protein n=1 Tax=Microbulbifer hainanensis TaxID=2735675 RepID=UPI001866100A|nr:DUF1097 domain-containing protein [Microbulbifer hainanensis]